MTFARWRKNGFDAAFVASEVARGTSPSSAGGLTFSGDIFFGDPLILLETGVEFLVPIPDVDRSRIIRGALKAALGSENYGPSVLIGEINKATRDFVRSPETKYVVAASLSFVHFQDLSRIEGSDCRLYVRRRLPKYLLKAREEAKQRSERTFSGGYPEDAPFLERYALAWIHVRGRSPQEAMDRAVEALDLRRGIWNFALNRRAGGTFPPPRRAR